MKNDQETWKKKFQIWCNEVGFQKEPTGLDVFIKMVQSQSKEEMGLVQNLEQRIEQINSILEEMPQEKTDE